MNFGFGEIIVFWIVINLVFGMIYELFGYWVLLGLWVFNVIYEFIYIDGNGN